MAPVLAAPTNRFPRDSPPDLALRWRPLGSGRLTLDLSVQNLLDEQYRDHASVADYDAIPGWEGVARLHDAGRDLRLTIGTRF